MNLTLLKGAVALASIGKELLNDKDVQKVVSSVKATATSTFEKVGAAVTEMRGTSQVKPEVCTSPPKGWMCTRESQHTGPCAAYSVVDELVDTNPDTDSDEEVCIFKQVEEIEELKQTIVDLQSVNTSLTAERNALKERLDTIQKSFQ
jgi:hypothetical protein